MKSTVILACEAMLQEHGYRVTKGRVALLQVLKEAKHPLSVSDLLRTTRNTLDKVTLYRALEDFTNSKIVAKIRLNDTTTYYEFIHHDHHHHHIICEQCGKLEDIEDCSQEQLQRNILKSSRSFATITAHSLEFFGVCKACSR